MLEAIARLFFGACVMGIVMAANYWYNVPIWIMFFAYIAFTILDTLRDLVLEDIKAIK